MAVFLRKYGTGTGADVYIPIIKRDVVDFAVTGDWTPTAGDVKISIDGGAAANIGTLPVINGTHDWKFVFADAELQGKVIRVRIVDSATKAIEDQSFTIETYGHASAMYKPDFSDSVRLGLTALPNAAAEAAGGLYTRGTGAGQINQAANGQIDGNVVGWLGTAPATPTTAGVPEVDVTHIAGSAVSTSSAQLGVNVVNAGGTAWGSGAITSSVLATDCVGSGQLAASAVTEMQSGLATSAEITALNDLSTADIDARLAAIRLDELLSADSDIDGAAPPTVGSVFHELMSKTAGSFTFDQTTDSLQAIRDRGDAAWTTAAGFSTHSAADVWSAATRTLTAGTNIVLAKGTGITGFNDIAATDIVSSGAITTSGGAVSSVTTVGSVTTKTGYKLASDGLDLIVPADPSAIPVLGTASIVVWMGWFGAWTVNEVNVTSSAAVLRNSADNDDLASHTIADDGTTFSSSEPS